jgi:hypothetical protein
LGWSRSARFRSISTGLALRTEPVESIDVTVALAVMPERTSRFTLP